jgi:pantetheine-phosphate adenylyltransferase
VHYGHIDIARRAAQIFGEVIVAVLDLPRKPLVFSQDERIQLFRQAVQSVPNIAVEGYDGLTVEFARQRGAAALVRGLRATSDFEYEYQMTTMNRHLRPGLETIFMMTSLQYAYLSSSLIKEVASLGAQLDGLVPPHVAESLGSRFAARE